VSTDRDLGGPVHNSQDLHRATGSPSIQSRFLAAPRLRTCTSIRRVRAHVI